ncbi:MAG: imidazolonepropionase [Promethearchaeota archaeon]|nr:MAG: imidazolonepropionase [Candidatus Lokiarchaeota archaeon]
MTSDDLDIAIIHANELVTLDSKLGIPRKGDNMAKLAVISDGALGIKDGKISFVGKTTDFNSKYSLKSCQTIINAKNRLVAPGFVDPHTHIIFKGSRENELDMKLAGKSYLEILESGGGILKSVRETRNASLDELVENGKNILDRMLRYGTTTIETKTGYGLSVEDEIKSLNAIQSLNNKHPIDIISTFMGAHAIPPEFKNNPEEYVDLIITQMLPQVKKNNLADFCDVFCEKGIFSIDQTERILTAAKERGLKLQVHVDEIEDTDGAKLAAKLKVIQAGHLLKSNDEGLKAMAEVGVIATLLPGTPFCLMLKEYAPARKMIDMGIPIALATDLNPNCWTESMQIIIALACYMMKMSPAEALTAATLNSACAIDEHHRIGSLEVGKDADINVFSVPNHQFLAYQFGVNLISKVIKKGTIIIDTYS